MSSKRPRSNKHDKYKKPDPKDKPSNLGTFVSKSAKYKHSMLWKKQIISSISVVLNDFEHLNLGQILRANHLEHFISIYNGQFSIAHQRIPSSPKNHPCN